MLVCLVRPKPLHHCVRTTKKKVKCLVKRLQWSTPAISVGMVVVMVSFKVALVFLLCFLFAFCQSERKVICLISMIAHNLLMGPSVS